MGMGQTLTGHPELETQSRLSGELEEVLRFGAQLLRAGDTAFRVRHSMGALGLALGFDELSVQIGLGAITATARKGEEAVTLVREVGPPGVNTARIRALEEVALCTQPDVEELAAKLDSVEKITPRYSVLRTSVAIGVSCGAFAFLNGGNWVEVIAATLGGGVGQRLRAFLFRRRYNQYAVAAMSALVASAVYCLTSALIIHAGLGIARHAAGFISSVLFLIPGFPLVAALLDLLQHQTAASVTRFAYAMLALSAAAFGLSVVTELVGLNVTLLPPPELPQLPLWILRIIASFAAAAGFAVLYNSSPRAVLMVGLLGAAGNALRLYLRDAGMMLGAATFLGAFTVGFIANRFSQELRQPPIALAVPGIIIMIPGVYAFQMVVFFNQGDMHEGLRAAVLVAFAIFAMAMGLAAARFLTDRESLVES